MKHLLKIAAVLFIGLTFFQCQQKWIEEAPQIKIIEPNFPEKAKEWGELFATNLNYANVEAKQNQLFKSTRIASLERDNFEKFEEFNNILSDFSEKQLKILKSIVIAKSESDSYIAFSNNLAKINDEIYKNVPKSEQERLFYITSALYFGLKEINNLVENGVIFGSHKEQGSTLLYLVRLKSSNVEDDPDEELSWWNNPKTFTTIWMIAIAEPTPIGEAVALALTAIVGSYLVLTRAECINNYVDCKLYTYKNNCYHCLRYCIAQGEWDWNYCD